jgi:hypothetical protein
MSSSRSRRRQGSPGFTPFSLPEESESRASASLLSVPTSFKFQSTSSSSSTIGFRSGFSRSVGGDKDKPVGVRIPKDCDDDDIDDVDDASGGLGLFRISNKRNQLVSTFVPPVPPVPVERLYHAGADGFSHMPSEQSVELLMSIPQPCFELIASFGLNARVLKTVCRRWLGYFSNLRIHWVSDNADRSILARASRLGSLVRLDLNDTIVTIKGLEVIARSATSLCFLNLSNCLMLNDANATLAILSTASRLRHIDLCGTCVAPRSDAICHLTTITRLSRLSFSDGVADVQIHDTKASKLPSLAAVLRLLDACPDLKVQFFGLPPILDIAAPAPSISPQQIALDAISQHGRIKWATFGTVAPRKVWPVCRALGCNDMPFFLTTVHPETGHQLECDSCGATPHGSDFLFCKRHGTFCPHCYEATQTQ